MKVAEDVKFQLRLLPCNCTDITPLASRTLFSLLCLCISKAKDRRCIMISSKMEPCANLLSQQLEYMNNRSKTTWAQSSKLKIQDDVRFNLKLFRLCSCFVFHLVWTELRKTDQHIFWKKGHCSSRKKWAGKVLPWILYLTRVSWQKWRASWQIAALPLVISRAASKLAGSLDAENLDIDL